jgi:hypothetical protein
VSEEIDLGAVREILHWGERMLDVQERFLQAEFAQTAEMLRLSVAAIGGVIIIAGLLATNGLFIDGLALGGLALGVVALMVSSFMLASILARRTMARGLAYGPDMVVSVGRLVSGRVDQEALLLTLASSLPEWLERNDEVILVLQNRKGYALATLTFAVVLILLALLYILGGPMHG